MTNTIKFSQFVTATLSDSSNQVAGVTSTGGGNNIRSPFVTSWTTATRPTPPFNGLLGYNTSIQEYEFWDSVAVEWIQLGSGDIGTVTQINTGTGLTGGPITTVGTISFAAIAANSLWANITSGSAVPTVIPTSTFLISANNLSDVPSKSTARTNLGLAIGTNVEAWSSILDQIAAGTWPGSTSITTLGTIAFGTWQGNTIAVGFGGTGNTTFTPFSVICAGTTATGAFQNVSGLGTLGQILTSAGPGALPTWQNSAGTGTVNAGLINQLAYYAANGTAVSGLATANNGVLITSSGGVPSISSTLPTAVQGNITQLGSQSQAINMNTHQINGVVDPTLAQDAATKNYVDQTALTGTSVYAASATTLGTVTQSGAGVGATLTNAGAQATFALDGVNPPVGVNVLIKNTATGMTAANEGIYTVTNVGSGSTNWVLTRATDYDSPEEINRTGLIVVQNGSSLAGTAWYNSATIVTVDTTSFNFNKFGSSGTVTSVGTAGLATGGPITSTGTITVTAAIQADQQTATSNTVAITPAVQQFHPSSVKAWASGTDTGLQNGSYNVSSLTNQSTGVNRFNFTAGNTGGPGAMGASATLVGGTLGFVTITNYATTYVETSTFNTSQANANIARAITAYWTS